MRTADVAILIVPGWSSSGESHWQTRWERSLKTARRVEQADWYRPNRAQWVARIRDEVRAAHRPVVMVAHSLGVIATVLALTDPHPGTIGVAGAFLVAPADIEHAADWPVTEGHTFNPHACGFDAIPKTLLPCPSTLVASATDPYCSLDRARDLATAWGSKFIEAGDIGHINANSGHGPWPEGLMQFGLFLKTLSPTHGE